jgi:hypothetical protein
MSAQPTTHDPYCLLADGTTCDQFAHVPSDHRNEPGTFCTSCGAPCICEQLAAARVDEREKAYESGYRNAMRDSILGTKVAATHGPGESA